MPRKSTRILAIAAAAVATALAATPAAQASAKCNPHGSKTLASDSYARAYGKGGQAFVCVKSTGHTTQLYPASPSQDLFVLAGKWVAWSSSTGRTVVHEMRIPDQFVPSNFPFDTNDHVDKIVLKSNGAIAWAATPFGGADPTYVQGMDRINHPPDLLSDDTRDVIGSSLKSLGGRRISWRYSGVGSDHTNLY